MKGNSNIVEIGSDKKNDNYNNLIREANSINILTFRMDVDVVSST